MKPWLGFLDLRAPDERIFWPYRGTRARLDYALCVFRAVLDVLIIAPLLVSATVVAVNVVVLLHRVVGTPPAWRSGRRARPSVHAERLHEAEPFHLVFVFLGGR